MPRLRIVICTLVLGFALPWSIALAGVCLPELGETLAEGGDPMVATGVDAARVLERAVELIEPALPPFVVVENPPATGDRALDERLRFLAERRLLPPRWSEGPIEPAIWREMLTRFLDWYDLQPGEVPVPKTDADLLVGMAETLERASEATRPAALFATDANSEGGLAFRALLWNWTSYPRLLVFRPAAGVGLDGGIGPAIASLENCARRIRHYFSAPEDTAARLFLANNQSRMIVVGDGSKPVRTWPWWVEPGDEIDVFGFEHPQVADLDVYSVVFAGPTLDVGTLLRLLPRIRTNASPLAVRDYLQSPR